MNLLCKKLYAPTGPTWYSNVLLLSQRQGQGSTTLTDRPADRTYVSVICMYPGCSPEDTCRLLVMGSAAAHAKGPLVFMSITLSSTAIHVDHSVFYINVLYSCQLHCHLQQRL